MCVITQKKLELDIARLCSRNFFIIGGISMGGGGGGGRANNQQPGGPEPFKF